MRRRVYFPPRDLPEGVEIHPGSTLRSIDDTNLTVIVRSPHDLDVLAERLDGLRDWVEQQRNGGRTG